MKKHLTHTFRSDETTDAIILSGQIVTGNKSEFITRCIKEYGREVMDMILKERSKAAQSVSRRAGRLNKGRRKGGNGGESSQSSGRLEQS